MFSTNASTLLSLARVSMMVCLFVTSTNIKLPESVTYL